MINGVSLITNGSGTGAKPEEEEIIDVTAFQAQLDDSVASARALVASWVPKNLGPSWDTPSTSSSSLASLAARGRPTRCVGFLFLAWRRVAELITYNMAEWDLGRIQRYSTSSKRKSGS